MKYQLIAMFFCGAFTGVVLSALGYESSSVWKYGLQVKKLKIECEKFLPRNESCEEITVKRVPDGNTQNN